MFLIRNFSSRGAPGPAVRVGNSPSYVRQASRDLDVVGRVAYLRRLLENASVVKFLSRKYADVYGELEKLSAATDLGSPE